jgi:uncharacterized membrane protein
MNLGMIGRYLFIIPIAIFGLFHFMGANDMAGMVPSWMPGGVLWVYLTGAALILSVVAFFMNKKAKLAMTLLGVMLLIFVLLLHLPGVLGGNQMSMPMLLKDTALAGGAFILSGLVKD